MTILSKLKQVKNNERFLSIKNEYSYLGYSFLVPAVIMLAIYMALGHKPLGNFSVLTLDLNAQYVYFYEALREFIYGDTSILYSFARSLGGEFMGIYAYYLASPLSYIVAIFPKSMMLFALLTIIIIKVGLCGLTFGFYLHKHSNNLSKNKILLFSIMYALSAYTITYQNNIMWLDGVFLLPILTYAIERLVKTGRCKLFVITLALIMTSHYYIGYMLCWYTFFCFFFTYFKEKKSEINPINEKNHFIKSLFRIGASSALGIGISAFIIGAAYYSLQFGKNEFTDPSWDMVAKFDIFDLFPKLLPGSYDTVMHEGLPLLYCGVLTLLLIPIFFMAKRVEGREKIFYGGFTALYVLLMVFNPTDLIMHGFQNPNCLNYRYSFIVIFLMLVMAYKAFCEIEEHSAKHIFATGAVILILLTIAQKMDFPNFVIQDTEDKKFGFTAGKLPFVWVVLFTIIAVFAVGAATCYFIKSRNSKKASQILLCVVIVELFLNGMVTFCSMNLNIGWSSYSSYADYFDKLSPIVESVQDSDKTLYRSEKTTHRCTNDNMALNIKGLSNSTSTLNQKVIDMLDYLGFYADSHWSQYLGATVVTDSIFGIKYVYSNIENDSNKESLTQNEFMDLYYELYEQDENYYAYKNPYSLGFAFGVSQEMLTLTPSFVYDYSSTNDDFKNPFEVQNILLNTLVDNTSDEMVDYFTSIPLKKNINIIGTTGTVGAGTEYSTSVSDNENDFVEFIFTVQKDGPLYLFIPTGYERTFTLIINDEHYITNYDHSRIIFLGYREAGEDMNLKFRLDENKFYFYKDTNYLYTLDMDAFEDAFEKLSQTTLVTNEKSNDHRILGTITTHEDNKTIMTTIPYDQGWRVYVDGKQVETYALYGEVFMAFDIENVGTHDIKMIYMPNIYVVSGIISLVSISIFIVWIIWDTRKKKTAKLTIPAQTNEELVDEAEIAEIKTEGEN